MRVGFLLFQKTKVIFDPSEVRRRAVCEPPPSKRPKKTIGPASAVSANRGTTTRAAAAAAPAPAAAPTRHSSGRGTGAAAPAASGKPICHFCQRQSRHDVVLVCRQCKTPGEKE